MWQTRKRLGIWCLMLLFCLGINFLLITSEEEEGSRQECNKQGWKLPKTAVAAAVLQQLNNLSSLLAGETHVLHPQEEAQDGCGRRESGGRGKGGSQRLEEGFHAGEMSVGCSRKTKIRCLYFRVIHPSKNLHKRTTDISGFYRFVFKKYFPFACKSLPNVFFPRKSRIILREDLFRRTKNTA